MVGIIGFRPKKAYKQGNNYKVPWLMVLRHLNVYKIQNMFIEKLWVLELGFFFRSVIKSKCHVLHYPVPLPTLLFNLKVSSFLQLAFQWIICLLISWYVLYWFPHASNNYEKKNCITYYTRVSLKLFYWYLSNCSII